MYLNHYWHGLRFMRALIILNISDVLVYLRIITTSSAIRLTQLGSIFFTVVSRIFPWRKCTVKAMICSIKCTIYLCSKVSSWIQRLLILSYKISIFTFTKIVLERKYLSSVYSEIWFQLNLCFGLFQYAKVSRHETKISAANFSVPNKRSL